MKKDNRPNVSEKQRPNLTETKQSNQNIGFGLCAALLCLLLASTLARDINRPFYGLHSWAEAHGPWAARVHLKYGLGYTKGFSSRAVGDLPVEKPFRYLDHPQLPPLLNAAAMGVLGIHTWSLRVVNIATTIITLLLFLKILRGLLDDLTALLAGLLFCLFPLIGYFGVNLWLYPFALWALWNYLVIIKSLKNAPEPKKIHKICLIFTLFMMVQVNWEGFFFAMAIGIHYVSRCIRKRQLPDKTLLTILIVAPLASLMLNFTIMAAGHGWNVQKIVDLFKWRAGSGEMREHDWGKWFTRLWKHSMTNWTVPILITTILYLTFGQLLVFMQTAPKNKTSIVSRKFPQFWLFFMPPVFQLFILKGALWPHQTWIRPFSFLIAIAAALGVMLLGDILKKANDKIAKVATVSLVCLFFIYCVKGTNYYYGIRWQAPEKIKMFQMLNQKIPPDKSLLSYEDFIVNQHKAKGAFYRPEIAWYLDREIVQARSFGEIQKYAQTGRFPCYLVPVVDGLSNLIKQLQSHYKFEYIVGRPGEKKHGEFYRAGMYNYLIFDLTDVTGISQ